MSAKSLVMKFGPGAVVNAFAKVNDLITELVTEVTHELRSEASSEAKNKSHRDDSRRKLVRRERVLKLGWRRTLPSWKQLFRHPGSQTVRLQKLHADLGAPSAQLKMDAMRVNEQMIFAKTVEVAQFQHVEKIVDVPVVLRHQAMTIQTEQKTPRKRRTEWLHK